MKARILLLMLAAGVVALSSPSFAASPGNYVMMPQMQGDAQREIERSYAYPSYRYVAPGRTTMGVRSTGIRGGIPGGADPVGLH